MLISTFLEPNYHLSNIKTARKNFPKSSILTELYQLNIKDGILVFKDVNHLMRCTNELANLSKLKFLEWENILGFNSMQTTLQKIVDLEENINRRNPNEITFLNNNSTFSPFERNFLARQFQESYFTLKVSENEFRTSYNICDDKLAVVCNSEGLIYCEGKLLKFHRFGFIDLTSNICVNFTINNSTVKEANFENSNKNHYSLDNNNSIVSYHVFNMIDMETGHQLISNNANEIDKNIIKTNPKFNSSNTAYNLAQSITFMGPMPSITSSSFRRRNVIPISNFNINNKPFTASFDHEDSKNSGWLGFNPEYKLECFIQFRQDPEINSNGNSTGLYKITFEIFVKGWKNTSFLNLGGGGGNPSGSLNWTQVTADFYVDVSVKGNSCFGDVLDKSNYYLPVGAMTVNFTENWTDMQRTTKYSKFHPWWLVGPLVVDTKNLLFLTDYKIKFKGVFRNNSIENTMKSK
jgi:hypothetical protein